MKKWIIIGILVLIIIGGFLALTNVDFGSLTIGLLERTANIDIEYMQMQGNIFKGYRIEKYNVRISETDSVYGEIAEIAYRFKPLSFHLPNLFEINLIQPTVSLTRTEGTGKEEKSEFSLPRINLGFRVNLKNGTLIYKYDETTTYTLKSISGLVFIDLIATKVYMNTINLSVTSEDYPIAITSANLDLYLSNDEIEMRSLKIKGKGMLLEGKGVYRFEDSHASFTLKRAEVDLDHFAIHHGTVDFSGSVEIRKGHIIPKIRGTAYNVTPLDRFNFETNTLADTIWVNIFDGELWDGHLFAQAKYYDATHWEFETNFSEINLSMITQIDSVILVNGYCGYRNNKFVGFLTTTQGVSIDSIRVYGDYVKEQITLDTLALYTNDRQLMAQGKLYPICDLKIMLDRINIAQLYAPFTVNGDISGTCHVSGDIRNITRCAFSIDVTAEEISYKDITAEWCAVQSDSFVLDDFTGYVKGSFTQPAYKDIMLDTLNLEVKQHEFSVSATQNTDTCTINGSIEPDLSGSISALFVTYRDVEIKSLQPFSFDIPTATLGEFDLSLLGGRLQGTITPRNLQAQDWDVAQLGKLVGLKVPIEGYVTIALFADTFSIHGRSLNFIGMENGSLTINGRFGTKRLEQVVLEFNDNLNQHLEAHGSLSFEHSHIEAKFTNLGVWIFPFLNPILLKPTGQLTGDVIFDGSFENINFSGEGTISNASFGVKVIEAQIDSLSCTVRFEKNRIVFQSAHGRVSTLSKSMVSRTNSAPINAGGFVVLEPRFSVKNLNFDVSFENAPVQYPPFAYGVGSGNFSFGAKDEEAYYRGAITVKQAVVPIEFGQEFEEGEEAAANQKWKMNVQIQGERNIWLRNHEADIEFGGEIFIIKEQEPLYISGIMETRRGNFYWLNHVLSITEGRVTFIPEEEVNAELDFWAAMDTRDRHPTTGEEIKIILHCFGTITEPIFEVYSDPPYYSEQDIMTYLNLNISWRELESMKQGEYVGAVLPNALLSWLESDVSRRIRRHTGLDYFRIETPFFEPESRTRVTVGKYISKDLFITYTYDITSFSNEFNVEYFLDDKNEIIIKKGDEGEYSLQYQYRIRF
jgi:hypothetical protein